MMLRDKLYFGMIMGMLLGLSIFALIRNKKVKINDLKITIKQDEELFLTKEIVNKLLIQKEDSLFYKQKETIDLNSIEQYIENYPYVNLAEIFILPNGQMNVEVEEREALFRVIDKKSYYVDNLGRKMPLSDRYTPLVPLFYGAIAEQEMKQTIQFIKRIKSDSYLANEVIHFEYRKGNYVLGLRSFDFDVIWGSNHAFEEKQKKLKHMCAYVHQQGDTTAFSEINLTFSNQIVAR